MRLVAVTVAAIAVTGLVPAAAVGAPVVMGAAAGPAPPPTRTAPAPPQPPRPAPAATDRRSNYADPLASLGATSPTCANDVGAGARANCRRTGSVAHRYPISSYGFDVQVGFSITDLGDSFLGALQSIAALLWMALVYLVKGALLLLEWSFSLDLLGTAMADVRRTLDALHRNVIGEPWFLAALSVTAVWGIWRGLVQGRASQTITGLAATVGLMVTGLVILANPAGTVGQASRLANEAALGVLSAATGGPIDRPMQSLSDAMASLFDQTVRDPWCALQFGSVEYCDQRAKGTDTMTNADVWLAYPAQSRERKGLYRLMKGEDADGGGRPGVVDALAGPVGGAALDLVGIGDDEDSGLPEEVRGRVAEKPERAAMQEAGGTVPRFALLALIALGMTGAVALLAYVGIRLLLASLLALILLLFAPAVLLAPAFGESGRATFVSWIKRLAGALAAKLIYALFLAVLLATAATIARLDVGWFGVWLVQIAFWWGVLIKRNELLGFTSAGATRSLSGGQSSSALSAAYHGAQLGWMGRRAVRGIAGPLAAPVAAGRGALAERRTARSTALARLASETLDGQAERAAVAEHSSATAVLGQRRQLDRELRVIDRQLSSYDEVHAAARAEGAAAPTPDADQASLLKRRAAVLAELAAPEQQRAEQIARRGNANTAQTGRPVGQRDLVERREARRRDLAADLPVDHERHLRAAGVDPAEYRAADAGEQARIRSVVEVHLDRERRLLATADGRPEVRFDPSTVRRRTAEERARLRAERRARDALRPGGRR